MNACSSRFPKAHLQLAEDKDNKVEEDRVEEEEEEEDEVEGEDEEERTGWRDNFSSFDLSSALPSRLRLR